MFRRMAIPAVPIEDKYMPAGTVNEMAAKFTAAYHTLKDKKDTERLLTLIKPMILTAKVDGISDKELIDLINALGLREKFYPAKLKELRGRLDKTESDVPASSEDGPPANDGSIHPLATAPSGRLEGAAA
ncbi:hypothetical protein BJD12_18775 [Xanthomonas vesicatoria ATCC 35937]|uniref:Uncharacterized protein n=2 Tax=Xanthomonas vesicatoria TaxID=56460 RepID=F0BIT1_9XANT|nr:hypothetical protein BJD12_18775 [Xanthomonas vesicatoria ATCC 35937]EGD07597.1 hypothetical protein XVE_4187 [Xanthomonas vesicatoria ATCC 35937]